MHPANFVSLSLLATLALTTACGHGATTNATVAAADAGQAPAAPKVASDAGLCTLGAPTLVSGGDAAPASVLGLMTAVRFTLPAHDADGNAQVAFIQGAGEYKSWGIADALDLYTRHDKLAQISGAAFDQNGHLIVSVKAYVNPTDGGTSGFLEVTDARTPGAVMRASMSGCHW